MAEPLSLQILQAVKNNKTVPIDYLAFKLGTDRQQIEQYVALLQQEGAVRRSADNVEMISPIL